MHNKNIIHIEGSEYWGRYIYLTAAQGFALVKLMFDNRFSKGVCEIGEVKLLQDLCRNSLHVDKNPQQFAYCPLSYGESY